MQQPRRKVGQSVRAAFLVSIQLISVASREYVDHQVLTNGDGVSIQLIFLVSRKQGEI